MRAVKKGTIAPVVVLVGALFMVLGPSRTGKSVELQNYRFEPAQISLRPGEALTFDNVSDTTHNLTCVRCPLKGGDVQPGLQKKVTFGAAGIYALACRYHADRGMGMRVSVGRPGGTPSPTGG